MNGVSKDYKVRLLTKAYLTLHKGKHIRANEIVEWITCNEFGLNNTSVTASAIVIMVKFAGARNDKLLRDVNLEKVNGVNEMWLDA